MFRRTANPAGKKSSRKKSSLKTETRSTRPTAGVTAVKADPDWQEF